MGENTFGRKKAAASDFSQPSLVSPTTPTLANPVRGFGLPTNNVIQKATEVSTDTQEISSEQQLIQEKPLGHDISRISFHRPQAKLTVGEPGDKYEQEADMMAHRVMSMPDTAVQKQISQQQMQAQPLVAQREAVSQEEEELQTKPLNISVQREISQEEEELQTKPALQRANNGTLEAGDSIENRLNSSKGSGSPLPDNVRKFMEPRFGADFSQVRVHTNSEAVQMNQELGAQAFTHGSDVYYGAGKSPGNNELTAHELTHVVQQTGEVERQTSTNVVQPKSTPSLQVGTQPKYIIPGQLTTLLVQRYRETIPVRDMGSGFSPSRVSIGPVYGTVDTTSSALLASPSYLGFEGRRIETTRLDEGTTAGRINFHLYQSTEIVNLVANEYHSASWDGIVPFTVSGEQVTLGSAIVDAQTSGSGASTTVSVGNASTPVGGYLTFTLSVNSTGSSGSEIGGGVSVEPLGVGVESSSSRSSSSTFSGGLTRTFTINVHTTPPSPITAPDVSFQVNSTQLEDGQEGIIANWWFERLSEPQRDAIRNGRRSISISGYASKPGRRSRNRELSQQRAQAVERILRGYGGSNASLNIFYFGEDNATTPSEREDPRWRRATIVVQSPNRSSPQTPRF